jgi:dTDP-glucose 4,6-dehydratase
VAGSRYLVTGGAGFIGSNFVHSVLSSGSAASVIVLDAFTYAANEQSLAEVIDDIELVSGNICDTSVLDPLVARSDIVVHFAAESHNDVALSSPARFVQSNLIGTYEVLQAVRKHERRLHHISTDEVFGDLELDDPASFTEDTPYRPSSPYSATKAGADHLVRAWVRSFGIAATISNCSNNYGPRQHVEKFIPRQITNALDGIPFKVYGGGRNVRDWIHVDDHNSAVLTIIDKGRLGETYLIGANGERSNLQVVEALARLIPVTVPIEFVTDRAGHDLRYAIDSTRLRTELGWRPSYQDFEAGLAATIDWYRQHESWWRPAKAPTESYYKGVEVSDRV